MGDLDERFAKAVKYTQGIVLASTLKDLPTLTSDLTTLTTEFHAAGFNDSDDEMSVGSKSVGSHSQSLVDSKKDRFMHGISSEHEHIVRAQASVEDHFNEIAHTFQHDDAEGKGLDALEDEYNMEFDDSSDHVPFSDFSHHHHLDDMIDMHITDVEADAVLIQGINIAERWGDEGLYRLFRGQKSLRDGNYEFAVEQLELALAPFRERDLSTTEEMGVLDLQPHISSLLIDAYTSYDPPFYTRAISVAKEWIKKYPKNVSPYSSIVYNLYDMGQYSDCINMCTEAIENLPETEMLMTVFQIRGHAKYACGKYEEAVEDYKYVKVMASKNLARFAPPKPVFFMIDRKHQDHRPLVIPKARPDKAMTFKASVKRRMEAFSVLLAYQMQRNTLKTGNQTSDNNNNNNNNDNINNYNIINNSNNEADVKPVESVVTIEEDVAKRALQFLQESKRNIHGKVLVDVKAQPKPKIDISTIRYYESDEKNSKGRNCEVCSPQHIDAKGRPVSPTSSRLLQATHKLGAVIHGT